ncbi:TPA: hypothetical protein U2D29_001092 [Streptococcus suis]|uniref:hypothetical protein n=1 Tax=Streptococcus suis TaxID=1307 RepID=UPI0015531B38|nr:hypothetical protein [Streptococcus suis]NQL53342.1 hypothetical protein [Streptococcus suis]NQM23978.1 hypothetical protein [Streptococcus suis]HEM4065939.1 hypothetical protein [Streptococcus suis]HEM4273887.1 hypothetical protein [Streptococcus suis]HEM6215301.1 hypothetical protein [Streptococcus suis]
MNLLLLFILRLKRNAIFLSLITAIALIPFAMSYRNVLEAENLRFEDRTRIIQVKKEAEIVLYADDKEAQALDQESMDYYKKLLELATTYLEKEHIQGKSQEVLETELELYQTMQNWEANGHNINHFTNSELAERITVYKKVLEQALTFHYPTAPKDFYLNLLQVLPASNYMIPLVICCLLVWLLLTDLSKHRGLLFINGLSPSQYATSLTLLALLLQVAIYALMLLMLLLLAQQFQFTFQEKYPIVIGTNTLSTISVREQLQKLLLELAGVTCCYLVFIRLATAKVLQTYKRK